MAISPGLENAISNLAKLCAQGKMKPETGIRIILGAFKFRDEVFSKMNPRQQARFLYELRQMQRRR